MGAQRAAWQVAFQAEAATFHSTHYASSLLDIIKAYERVPLDKVAAAARKHGYSITVLRLTFAAYNMQRSVGIGKSYSRLIVATCGITAGSISATAELKILLLDIINDTYTICRSVSLYLYVDDFTIEAHGDYFEACVAVSGATDFVVNALEMRQGLRVRQFLRVRERASPP